MKPKDSRRSFIGKITGGFAFSAVAMSSAPAFSSLPVGDGNDRPGPQKKIRVGIIGAENSHSIGYGTMFNTEKKFPGVEVVSIWGETEEFARTAMEKGNIPKMVKDPLELLGKIDALIVDHRHAKYHCEAALPFIKEKIPTFIDKPFCYRVSEGKEFLSLARSLGTPVTSYSTASQSDMTLDLKSQVESMGQVYNFVYFCTNVDIESPWGGVFFYGIHYVEEVLNIFGDNVQRVRVSREGRTGTASMVFNNGVVVTLVFLTRGRGNGMYIETRGRLVELKPKVEEKDPPKCYTDMVEMFRTGKEPKSHDRILYPIAVLEALERSVESDKWEDVSSI